MAGIKPKWILGLSVAVCAALAGGTVTAAPWVPASDQDVVARLPTRPGDARVRELASLRQALAAAPTSPSLAAGLAQAYFDMALAQGDPRYVGYAEALLSAFDKAMTPELWLARGQLRQYRHQFALALQDFASALAAQPSLAQAHAWRGAIYLVQARHDLARAECDALTTLGRGALAGACTGLLQAYTGQLSAAQATLKQALAASREPDSQLWLHTRLAEVADWQGNPRLAEQHYRAALALGRDDSYLLAAWSDHLLDAQRPDEVLMWLANWEGSDALLLRLTEAEVALKRPQAAAHVQAVADRFAAARLRGDLTHRAEEARFELRLRANSAAALALAQANHGVQREPRDARILMEAALAAGQPSAAQSALDWLRDSGFADPKLQALASALKGGKP